MPSQTSPQPGSLPFCGAMLVPSPFIGSMAPSAAHGTRLGPAYDQPQDARALQLTAVAAAMMTGAPPAMAGAALPQSARRCACCSEARARAEPS